MILLALVSVPSAAVQAQDAALPYAPGEILLGWRVDASVCGPAGSAQSEISASLEECRLLADLAPAASESEGLLAEPRDRPEWQAAADALALLTGLEVRDLLPAYGIARLGVDQGSEAAQMDRLRRLPWVAYAEPNYLAQAASPSAEVRYPNDPFIGDQWNMRRVAAPEAWAVTRGSYSIIIAVLDSGIDLGHPEFANRLMPGYDYVNDDNVPNDDYGHGTHVAGLIAANVDNFTGISGLAPNVRLLPLKVLDNQGQGTYFDIATAIRRASDANAQVINLSLGGFANDATLKNAVDYAVNNGRLVVAASGNCAQISLYCPPSLGSNPNYYPAAYPGVLAVAASDRFDNWASYSGYKSYVGLAAPGGIEADQVWSTVPGGYGVLYGTSMATPLASAAAVLVWTMQPGATAQEVAGILKNTADKVGAFSSTGQPIPYVNGRNDYFGSGRLNVARAVRWAYPPSITPVSEVQRFLTSNPSKGSVRAVVLANPSEQAVQWQAQVLQGSGWLNVDLPGGQTTYSSPGALILRVGPAALAPGVYTGRVRVASPTALQVAPIDIEVELRVAAQLYYSHLPATLQDWYSIRWLDPLAPGTPAPQIVNLSDNTSYYLALPFPVTFYGRSYTGVWVSDNGLVWFGSSSFAAAQPPSVCLPSASAPNNAIYALALDWIPALGGRIYAHTPDADTYVITWLDVQRLRNATPQSFQLVFRRSGEMAVSYRAIEAFPPAIIGTENDDGTVAEQLFCNGIGRLPVNGDTFRLNAVLPWQ